MDIVYLHGIACECTIGVWEWEKAIRQKLIMDIDVGCDISKAAENDDLNDALDYQALAEVVQLFASEHQFDLLETLAERLASLILSDFKAPWVKIKIDKGPAVKGVKHVGVMIERSA